MMNNRNIDASGKPETIWSVRKRSEAKALLLERREQARRRFDAMVKDFSSANVSYVTVNGVSMPVPRG